MTRQFAFSFFEKGPVEMAKFLLFASLLVLSGIVAQEGGTHEDHEGHEGHEGHPPLREVFDELKEEFHGRFGEEHDNQGEFTKTIAVTFALKGVQDDKGQFYHSVCFFVQQHP